MHDLSNDAEYRVPQAEMLLSKAAQCRRLAIGIADRQTATGLTALAEEYEREAGYSAARAQSA